MESFRFAKRLDGSNRYITVQRWRGETRIDIREWEGDSPSKKGVSLTLNRWKMLCYTVPDIRLAIKRIAIGEKDADLKAHLGGNMYVSVTRGYGRVDIRQFWLPENEEEIKATRKGIALCLNEWEALVSYISDIEKAVPEIMTTVPCVLAEDHMNQEGMLRCRECNPNQHTER